MTIEMKPVRAWEGLGARRRINDVERAACSSSIAGAEKRVTSRARTVARKAALAVLEGKKEAPALRAAFVKGGRGSWDLARGEERASMKIPARIARPSDMT